MRTELYFDEKTKRSLEEYASDPNISPMRKIKKYRTMHGYTTREMARIVGCSQPTYSQIESRCIDGYPNPNYVRNFANHFNLSLIDVWGNFYEE